MKLLHRLVQLVLLIGLLAAGLVVFCWALSADRWSAVIRTLDASRITALWAGFGLCCLGVLFALTGLSRGRRERFLSFDSEGGTVSISTTAIADYVGKLAGEFPAILRLRPIVIPGRHSIDIIAELRVKAGPQVHEVCELLQQRIRESVTNGLGIADVRRVEVSVKEIASEHKPA